ncbi:MAG: substrate-binding domain-containing protein [Planctomycetota bacterium]
MPVAARQPPATRRKPARLDAKRQLTRIIDENRFGPSGLLPSERDLSTSVGVSRPTVRLVLEELCREGKLSRVEGRGWAVAQNAKAGLMNETILLVSELNRFSTASMGLMEGIVDRISRAATNAAFDTLAVDIGRLLGDRLEETLENPPTGVIFAVGPSAHATVTEPIRRLRTAGIPVVAYGSSLIPEACDRVISDHQAGARKLVDLLARRGRRRILRVWSRVPNQPTRPYWLDQRDAGYEAGCREAGLDVVPTLEFAQPVIDGMNAVDGFEAKVRLMVGYLYDHFHSDDRPDAIMVNSDGVAFAVAKALQVLGVDPNHEVPIVGYDNYYRLTPESSVVADFQLLATIDKDHDGLGQAIVSMLADRTGNRASEPGAVTRVVEPKLVINPFFPDSPPVPGFANTGTVA